MNDIIPQKTEYSVAGDYIGVYISNYQEPHIIQNQIQFIQTAMHFCVFMVCSH